MDAQMKFEPIESGFSITFSNGWTVKAATEPGIEPDPGKVKIQAFMPEGFPVYIYGSPYWIITSDDLATVLMQTSQIPKGIEVSDEYASQSFEAMLEGLIFGVAA